MAETKKKKTGYMTRARGDMQYLLLASDYLKCDKCSRKLGIARCLRFALFKKRGSEYFVPCKVCGYRNKRVKGNLALELNDRW